MVNIKMLQEEIDRQGITVDNIAKTLGIDRSSWYRKKENPAKLKIGEVETLKKMLGLSDEKAIQIFLSNNSQKCEKTDNYSS